MKKFIKFSKWWFKSSFLLPNFAWAMIPAMCVVGGANALWSWITLITLAALSVVCAVVIEVLRFEMPAEEKCCEPEESPYKWPSLDVWWRYYVVNNKGNDVRGHALPIVDEAWKAAREKK